MKLPTNAALIICQILTAYLKRKKKAPQKNSGKIISPQGLEDLFKNEVFSNLDIIIECVKRPIRNRLDTICKKKLQEIIKLPEKHAGKFELIKNAFRTSFILSEALS